VIVLLFVAPLAMAPFESVGQAGLAAGVERLAALPLWFRVFLALTGGAIEEILYRGYAIERLSAITGRRWLGATLALAAFTVAHVPAWGAGFAFTADLAAGTVLTLSYLWKRDLFANVLAHSTTLVIAMGTLK
jgi:membrane protease YdiL (CAAX protease family)